MSPGEKIVNAKVNEDELKVELLDGRMIVVPLAWHPRLLHATPEQRANWKIAGTGHGIHWADVDEDLSLEGLLCEEEHWWEEKRSAVVAYLKSEEVRHGRIGEWPAWHVAPYVSIWAIESLRRPEWIGWWVIAGDLPTDYISAADIAPPQHPRKAANAIAERWLRMAKVVREGAEYDGIQIAGLDKSNELAPMLECRARLLIEWAGDDSLWDEE